MEQHFSVWDNPQIDVGTSQGLAGKKILTETDSLLGWCLGNVNGIMKPFQLGGYQVRVWNLVFMEHYFVFQFNLALIWLFSLQCVYSIWNSTSSFLLPHNVQGKSLRLFAVIDVQLMITIHIICWSELELIHAVIATILIVSIQFWHSVFYISVTSIWRSTNS